MRLDAAGFRQLVYNYVAGAFALQPQLEEEMKHVWRTIKGLLLWSYSRKTWQYDVLCAVILAFIFLTPKSWFETSELHRPAPHQSPFTSVLLAEPQPVAVQADRAEVERRVRELTGQPDARVSEVRPRRDAAGRIIAYEVDIR